MWAAALLTIGLIANWPQNAGTLKRDIWQAGFPLTYARWVGDKLVEWDLTALLLDVLLWVVVLACIAGGLALARRRNGPLNASNREGQQRASLSQ
jgi:hypothetical protein